jgi:hypothetical protein
MPHDPHVEDVRGQYRTILSLTRLFATINNHGKPTLAEPNAPWKPFDDSANQGHDLVLNAIVTLLVRKSEIAAAMVHHDDGTPTLASEPSGCEPSDSSEFFDLPKDEVSEEDGGRTEAIQSVQGSEFLRRIIIVANPDRRDRYIDRENPLQCLLVDRGKSHMAGIRHPSNYWENCFKIS